MTVYIAILNEDTTKCLMLPTGSGEFNLPGTVVDRDEDPVDACYRLMEQQFDLSKFDVNLHFVEMQHTVWWNDVTSTYLMMGVLFKGCQSLVDFKEQATWIELSDTEDMMPVASRFLLAVSKYIESHPLIT